MPAVSFTPVAVQTLASGEDSPHSTCTIGGALFVGLVTSPGKLIKWADPTNLASYNVLTFSTNENYVNQVAVAGGFIYTAHNPFFDGGVTNHYCINVSKIDPSAMTRTTLVKIDTGSLSVDPGIQMNVATDGTNLYVLTAPTTTDSVLYKVLLSSGAVLGSVTITGRQFGHTLVYDPVTAKLYMAGSTPGTPRTCWAARVDPALTGLVSLAIHSANNALITDDSSIVGNEYWVALEGTATGLIKRVALDMSGYTDLYVGQPAQLYGAIYDGGVIWVPTNTSPGSVIALSPGGNVLNTTVMTDAAVNEFQVIGNYAYATHFVSPGKVVRGLLGLSTYPATILATPGLLSYYRLGEPSGTAATDRLGRATGLYGGSPTLGATGLISADADTAVTFNGSSQYVDISDSGLPTGAAARTLEAWIKTTDGASASRAIVGYGVQTTGQDFEMRNTFGALGLVVRPTLYTLGGVVNSGTPTHCVVTFDGANAQGYVNGVAVGSPTAVTPATVLAGSTGLEIGVWANFFLGTIDEVAIYNRALSAAEVRAHYDAGVLGAFTPVLLTAGM